MGDISAEPSMEEILSSIKRIMAEEGEGPVRSRRPARPIATTASSVSYDDEGDSILELDDPIAPMPRITPEPVVAPRPMIMASTPRHEPVAEEADEPVPAPPPPRPAVSEPDADAVEPLVSDRAATASRQAIDQLTRTLSAAAPAATPAGAPTADASLEGLVREMLRPMLRDWLDSRLPAIVEQHVAAEIARITGSR
ncbi:pole-organizing protein PopZ [Sphingomonas cynarae]|uniref:Pole-organizing protein PopZ n=1 Tax=Sphingomonas cynarae TaxID=930197 RepID=A0ABP7E7X0_9SPHN